MKETDIRALIGRASAGDQIALTRLVEWGLHEVLLQFIAEGFLPVWARVRLQRDLGELARRRDSLPGARQARGDAVRKFIEDTYQQHRMPVDAEPPRRRATFLHEKVRNRAMRSCALDAPPCLKTVRRFLKQLEKARQS